MEPNQGKDNHCYAPFLIAAAASLAWTAGAQDNQEPLFRGTITVCAADGSDCRQMFDRRPPSDLLTCELRAEQAKAAFAPRIVTEVECMPVNP